MRQPVGDRRPLGLADDPARRVALPFRVQQAAALVQEVHVQRRNEAEAPDIGILRSAAELGPAPEIDREIPDRGDPEREVD